MDKRMTKAERYLALHTVFRTASVKGVQYEDAKRQAAKCLVALCQDGHAINVEAGWWTDVYSGEWKDRNVGEILMLAVSELAEVPAKGLTVTLDDKLPNRLAAEVEIGDCIIRLFDTFGSLKNVSPEQAWAAFENAFESRIYRFAKCSLIPSESGNSFDVYLMSVVRDLSAALEGHRKGTTGLITGRQYVGLLPSSLALAIVSLFAIGNAACLDLCGAIMEKMEYNRTRADHQLANRRKGEGKKF